ncbi:MAG: inorganic pyrophosphatase [Acidimicrobiales bacterium]
MAYHRLIRNFDRFRAHPWHGLPIGDKAPNVVDAFIEITPFDAVKYEIDKITGYLRVDRPQGSSALPPTLYGFIPRTYCGQRVADLTPSADTGDGDPLDICVLSQQRIDRAEVVLPARILGGIQVLDGGEADDKIVAVLESDTVFDYAKDIKNLPTAVVQRIVHYFATYKMDITGQKPNAIEVIGTYGAEHARAVVEAALADYTELFGDRTKRRHDD